MPGYKMIDSSTGKSLRVPGITRMLTHSIPGVSQKSKNVSARRKRVTGRPSAAPRGAKSSMRVGTSVDKELALYIRNGSGPIPSTMSPWPRRLLNGFKLRNMHPIAAQLVVGDPAKKIATEVDIVVKMMDPNGSGNYVLGFGEIKTGYDTSTLDTPGPKRGLPVDPPGPPSGPLPRRKKGDPPRPARPTKAERDAAILRMPNTVGTCHFMQAAAAKHMYDARVARQVVQQAARTGKHVEARDIAPEVVTFQAYVSLRGKPAAQTASQTMQTLKNGNSYARSKNMQRTFEQGANGDGTVMEIRMTPPGVWSELNAAQRTHVYNTALTPLPPPKPSQK